ncbi:MAG: hypothetical protein C0616_14455 [Desulfuromonas sp.]|nr:MAG: hypothetical protein C0616_14455 [Desulfuromonas sp.]
MRVLIVTPEQNVATGNWVTARRLADGLQGLSHRVEIRPTGLNPSASLLEALDTFQPNIAILLHAYRSGAPWLQAIKGREIPFLVLLTGTDLNVGLDDSIQRPVIQRVLRAASGILLQNRLQLEQLKQCMPQFGDKLRYLPPGIQLGKESFDIRYSSGATDNDILFFCPAGLRPVKQQLELLKMFDRVVADSGNSLLAFAGPVLDPEYATVLQEGIDRRERVVYLGVIPHAAMAAAIRDSDIVVNNSKSEGLSNALLEADALGVPILARDIPGNREIVVTNRNGLLFPNEEEFVALATRLANDNHFRSRLGDAKTATDATIREALQLERFLLESCSYYTDA